MATVVFIEVLESSTCFNGKSCHFRRTQAILKLGSREHEIDLTGLKLVFRIQTRYEIVEVKAIGIADEGSLRRHLRLKNLRDVDGNCILTELSVG